uniref:Uncharacterized protein n=1 Tax=Kalanchoe fedtschenkoi TaxID=63787 RepID=A0A7N0VIH6_KALFE
MSSKKKEQQSEAMKRTGEWISAQDIPSDVTVHAGGVSFSLHKFPLVSKSGHIRKLVAEAADPEEMCVIDIPGVPGGAEAFELAAKFCYGINFDLGTENIALLRCVAEYLEMTEEYGAGNLLERTETYLNEVVLKSLASAVSVLHLSESLLPMAEKVKLVSRCVDAIAVTACKETHFSGSQNDDSVTTDGLSLVVAPPRLVVDWWAEDLTVLRIDIFQRVLNSMMARGFKQHALGPILMLYAQKSLRGLENFGRGKKKMEAQQEHEKRIVLETIVSLLPREKNVISVSFLSMLLRASIYLETTVACRLDLERRMGSQLSHAALHDLLIPSYSFTGDTLFDVDTVKRILANYLETEMEDNQTSYSGDEEFVSISSTNFERVGKLMETYLAEIASDRNLSVLKFISIAEIIPEKSRATEDGMYRAIDIYLKAHPSLSDLERKKICGFMDCQKLSREACAHAAQNDRLPVQTVVQVLYYEQQRLQDGMSGRESPAPSSKQSIHSVESPRSIPSELSSLKRENEDLKIELVKMKMKMKEIERQRAKPGREGSPLKNAPQPSIADKPPLPRKSFINSVSKKLSALVRADGFTASGTRGRSKPSRDRRHSIS